MRLSRDRGARTWTAPADIHGTFRGGYSPAIAAAGNRAVWSASHRLDGPCVVEPLGVAIASNGTIVASWLRYITDFATVATAFLTP